MDKTVRPSAGLEPQRHKRSVAIRKETYRYAVQVMGPLPTDIVARISELHAIAAAQAQHADNWQRSRYG